MANNLNTQYLIIASFKSWNGS